MPTFDDFAEQTRKELIITEQSEDSFEKLGATLQNRSVEITLEILRRYHCVFQELD